ncbi:hydrogenase nickel incorporation protein HypB [Streptomyces albipurpureus]|uniref:Hydrogenase nickel incorporation protein HypB n=1 Tax=Streptomyces albipurpureus TaxID=2897419 RepID=A0ABT0UZ52_9ACTN|nr:hydrogenase nickel incorporation protein HypB [Streptomyces sp. CWNU-1]MCM2393847.1 hydrogenase nickel incorporation protein HypB [Streptomyces sp. CWNU-1]
MCRTTDLRQAVLARNDDSAQALRAELTARGAIAVNMLSSPGSGKTALLESELALARERGVPVAALTADLATENDAKRLARAGVPVRQVLTDGLCHIEAVMLRGYVAGWLPARTQLLFVENVGNLVCPAAYDLGESLRVTLVSVTEGEDKPLKYPGAFGLANLVVLTKTDIAAAVGFDQETFLGNVARVNPGVEVVFTSARSGQGIGVLLERALAVRDGAEVHRPVMTRTATHDHAHSATGHRSPSLTIQHHGHGHDHDHGDHTHAHDQQSPPAPASAAPHPDHDALPHSHRYDHPTVDRW